LGAHPNKMTFFIGQNRWKCDEA